eukprot:753813-Hanusia_phi.AAC.5
MSLLLDRSSHPRRTDKPEDEGGKLGKEGRQGEGWKRKGDSRLSGGSCKTRERWRTTKVTGGEVKELIREFGGLCQVGGSRRKRRTREGGRGRDLHRDGHDSRVKRVTAMIKQDSKGSGRT